MIGRDEAVATLAEGKEALDRLFAQLSDAEMERPNTIGDAWSAKDLLGHVAFWEELALAAIAACRAGRRPERVADGVDAANARNQERTREEPLAEVRARAAASHAAVLDAIQSIDDAAWAAVAPGRRKRSLADLVGGLLGAPGRPFGHPFAHLADLAAYVGSLRR
jgi:hypothetical protein